MVEKKNILKFLLINILLLFSCVENPKQVNNTKNNNGINKLKEALPKSGALILCEGLWGNDNSDIWVVEQYNGLLHESISFNSFGTFLGDLASDFISDGKNVYILVSTNKKIEILNLEKSYFHTPKYFSKDFKFPRSLSLDESYIYFVDLYSDKLGKIHSDSLFNKDNKIQTEKLSHTGAAPEELVIHKENIYVANSGFGDYRHNENHAGYLTIYDKINLSLINSEYIGKNFVEIEKDTVKNLLLCNHLNLPSKRIKGEKGGIKIYDIDNNYISDSIEINAKSICIDTKNSNLYIITENELLKSNYSNKISNPESLLKFDESEILYGIEFNEKSNTLWILNAKNHTRNGEVIIYDLNSNSITHKYEVGINPRKVLFY